MTHAFLGRWSVPLSDGRHVLAEARRPPGTGRPLWVILPNGTGPGHGNGRERERDVELAIARLAAESRVIYRPRAGGTAGEAE